MRFQTFTERISGVTNITQLGEGVWGMLKGRVVRYMLRGYPLIIGRSTSSHQVSSFLSHISLEKIFFICTW